ncbi:MAG: 3-hydroxybutyryl-CoA dehydrogenase [Acidimicrobiaceae bacterium]|nr:3-hydroxybutyryl-CoA dehydrogenase [Acidimicrobiaceae bacterium]MBJ31590.1 3-hydroxybutyryl-CoA dehydrogenase [Acidimicrobiaceae bacterium]|tara:strand:+ start:62 stop:940 length:879 start_codon:yes stop_codon:yes gene_type:complete
MTVEPGANLTVIGGGTMGRGIAALGAARGYHVRLVDTDPDVVATVTSDLKQRIERLRADLSCDAGSLIATTDLNEAVGEADVVIEAVPEEPDLKRNLFATLRSSAPEGALLASNTSTLSITDLAAAADNSPRVIGMHFFNPAHRMALVEVIISPTTDEKSLDDAVTLCRQFGKEPVIVRDTPGFVTSRLGLLLGNEAMRIVEEGVASAADVDTAMRLGYNHPMGPLELADLVGLDARLNNLRSVASLMGRAEFEPPQVLVEHVAAGRFGRKSGEGFYQYDNGTRVTTTVSKS